MEQITTIDQLLIDCFPNGSTITLDANWLQAQLKAYHRTANEVKSLKQTIAEQAKTIAYYQQRSKHPYASADYFLDVKGTVEIFNQIC